MTARRVEISQPADGTPTVRSGPATEWGPLGELCPGCIFARHYGGRWMKTDLEARGLILCVHLSTGGADWLSPRELVRRLVR